MITTTFKFACPHCAGHIEAETTWARSTAPCPHCAGTLTIPRPAPSVPHQAIQQTSAPKPNHRVQPPPQLVTQPARKRGGLTFILVVVLLVAGGFAYSSLRNTPLQNRLKSCETFGVVKASTYYGHLLTTDTVVFDLKRGSSSGARRIDPVHLLMQFAAKLDFDSLDRVVLARDGTQKFYVRASDLRELAGSYDAGGRVWAFDHLPERTRTMSGERAYSEWTGGWLGVAQRQTDDLNSFIEAWTGY